MLRAQGVGKNETHFISYTFFAVSPVVSQKSSNVPHVHLCTQRSKMAFHTAIHPHKKNVLLAFILP